MSKSPNFSLIIIAFFDDFQLVKYKKDSCRVSMKYYFFLKNGKGIELLKIQHAAPTGAIWRLVFGGLNNNRLI